MRLKTLFTKCFYYLTAAHCNQFFFKIIKRKSSFIVVSEQVKSTKYSIDAITLTFISLTLPILDIENWWQWNFIATVLPSFSYHI